MGIGKPFFDFLSLTPDGNRSFKKIPERKDLKHPQKRKCCHQERQIPWQKRLREEERMSFGISQEERDFRESLGRPTLNIYFFMLIHKKLNLEEKPVWVYTLNHFCQGESPFWNCT